MQQWALPLGHFDMATTVMPMSSSGAISWGGDFLYLQHTCNYPIKMKSGTIKLWTHSPKHSSVSDKQYDWTLVYGEVSRAYPTDITKPLGEEGTLLHYVNANLFHEAFTSYSARGFLHTMNAAQTNWFARQQATVKTATYRSKYIAVQTCVDHINTPCTTKRAEYSDALNRPVVEAA